MLQPNLPKTLIATAVLAALSATASGQSSDQSLIQEVLITAQRREQALQDASVAVSAFSGDAIEKMGFEEGLDIIEQVPNMSFFAIFGEASSPSVSLRGISLVNFSDSWESPVAIYVDDVYKGNPAGSAIQLFDLERVEVLRGPQGTLYGRNTTGGLVHYISRKPTHTFDASASASYGSFNERILQGMISGPLSDGVRGRIAVKSTVNDGWQTNALTGEDLNTTDNLGYRAQLAFDLTQRGELLLSVHGSRADQKSVGFAHMGYLQRPEPDSPKCDVYSIQQGLCTSYTFGEPEGETPNLTGADQVNDNFGPRHVASSAADGLKTEIDTFGTSANINWDFGTVQLTSITAYETLDKFLQDDGDGTEHVFFDEQYTTEGRQLSQEVRLNGNHQGTEWVLGAYFYDDRRDMLTQAPTTADATDDGTVTFWHHEEVRLDTQSWALFSQAEYPLTSQLTAVAGLRYTAEERDFHQQSGPSFYSASEDYPLLQDIGHSLSSQAVTGRLGLDWRPEEHTLAYASFSTGFKSGGFSASYNASYEATLPVEEEYITNLELGYKTQSSDGRWRLNTAVFAYLIEDYQAQVFLTVAEGGVIVNAGDVRGLGAEAELTAQVTEQFELILGAGLLDTEFDSEQVFVVAGDEYSLDGNELPSAPTFNYNFVARYYLPMANRSEWVLQADYTWQDSHYLQLSNDPYARQGAYGLANAKVSWHSPSMRYTVAAFGNNLFNKEYFTYQNTLGDDWGYGVWGKPRTVGLRASWRY